MKSLLFSALAIVALASTGCAIQSGGSQSLCGKTAPQECMVLTGDCGCSAPKGLAQFGGLFNCSDKRGMAMCMNGKGTACDQGKNNGLFSRKRKAESCGDAGCGCNDVAATTAATAMTFSDGGCGCDTPAAASDCGCGVSAPAAAAQVGDCGCGTADAGGAVYSAAEVAPVEVAASGAGSGTLLGSLRSKGCLSGKCGLGSLGGGGCLSGKCGLGLGGKVQAASACGVSGCGVGGAVCGGCLSKIAGARKHPYGGAIPHTAQVPGAGTGMAPSYAYPYYTTRGPRDFLMKKPPSIGY